MYILDSVLHRYVSNAPVPQEEEGEEPDYLSWLDEEQGAISDKDALSPNADSRGIHPSSRKDIVHVLKLQLEEANDHNQMIQDEMIKLKSQWEVLARERDAKLESELQQRLVEATERLELEEKVEASWAEIKQYQDTLQHSQDQLHSAQVKVSTKFRVIFSLFE